MIFGLEFPPIENLVEWPNWFGPEGSWYGFNKIAFISLVAIVATSVLFILGNRKRSMVPKGAQNLVESSVAFIRDGIVLETMGPDGMRYLPYLVSLFFFILIGNIFEVIPFFHMPANARMAGPAVLALITWAYYIAVGLKHQGPKYFINAIAPPGVPKALYILVVPIEFLSTFIVRPFSLAVRLFANMLAGHILLVTFALLTESLFQAKDKILIPFGVLPMGMLIFLTGFEVLVAFLQAYIFTILTAVYIGGAVHPEH